MLYTPVFTLTAKEIDLSGSTKMGFYGGDLNWPQIAVLSAITADSGLGWVGWVGVQLTL